MITEQENDIRNLFFEEKGIKAYEGHINDGDKVIWKEEYVKWLESKLSQHDVSNRREQLIAYELKLWINPTPEQIEIAEQIVDMYLRN